MAKRRNKSKFSGYQPNTNKRPEVSAQKSRESLTQAMAHELRQQSVTQNTEALLTTIEHFISQPEAVLTMWVPQLRAMDLQSRRQYGIPLFPGFDFDDTNAVAAVFTPMVKIFAALNAAGKSARRDPSVVAEALAPFTATLAKFS